MKHCVQEAIEHENAEKKIEEVISIIDQLL